MADPDNNASEDKDAGLTPDKMAKVRRRALEDEPDLDSDEVLLQDDDDERDPGVHPHQDELLDEGIEETFPASDPVSVKRIT